MKQSAVIQALAVLSRRDRYKLGVLVLAQTAANTLDLVGVMLLGLVGVVSISAVNDAVPKISAPI